MLLIYEEHVPQVIDDASHIGYLSRLTFEAVFPYPRLQGRYIVDDWDTVYWDDWPDGSCYQQFPIVVHDGLLPKRLQSHDCGIVGFIKSLVNLASEGDIRRALLAPRRTSPWMILEANERTRLGSVSTIHRGGANDSSTVAELA